MADEVWAVSDAYEAYVGRWSLRVADQFVRSLGRAPGSRWLDAGCGTGALTVTVLATARPTRVVGVDPSTGFLTGARTRIADDRAAFCAGDAAALPFAGATFDTVVSGLVLNFLPDPARALAEFVRLAAPRAVVAAYVWDYADGMDMMRQFWDAAAIVDPAAAERDQGRRFPLCQPGPLAELWLGAGLAEVSVEGIEIPTDFQDFDDYWRPFLGGQGAAPGYVASLPARDRDRIREVLRSRLPTAPDGSIRLTARAWAVRGVVLSAGQLNGR